MTESLKDAVDIEHDLHEMYNKSEKVPSAECIIAAGARATGFCTILGNRGRARSEQTEKGRQQMEG